MIMENLVSYKRTSMCVIYQPITSITFTDFLPSFRSYSLAQKSSFRGSLSICYFLPCSLCFIYLFLLGPEVCCLPILYFFKFDISIKHFHLFFQSDVKHNLIRNYFWTYIVLCGILCHYNEIWLQN